MAVLGAGARLAQLAARLAEEGNPNLRGDAVVAAVLAGAGAEGAAALVRINLAELPGDGRLALARSLLDDAGTWVARARRSAARLTLRPAAAPTREPVAAQEDPKDPESMTVSPLWLSVRKRMPSSSSQIEIVSVSPGYVGLENRPAMERKRVGSEPHTAWSRARPVNP